MKPKTHEKIAPLEWRAPGPKDDTELFKQFMDNESFRRWMTDTVFGLTYEAPER